MSDNGMARAQASYDAQMPPESEEAEYTVEVAVTFYLTLPGCTFFVDEEPMHMSDQVKDWMRDDLMPRLTSALRAEIEPPGAGLRTFIDGLTYGGRITPDPVVDSEYEITDMYR